MTPMSENKGLMYALFGVGVFSVALAGNFLPEVILASNLKFENRLRVDSVYKKIKKNCSNFE